MSNRNTRVAAHATARGIPTRVVNSMKSVNDAAMPTNSAAPAPTIEPEIHREIGNMENTTRNLSATVEALVARLEPVLHAQRPQEDGVGDHACETTMGHRLREQRTSVEISITRLNNLLERLAI